jgi:SOS response regulatory protein OraA/RecX
MIFDTDKRINISEYRKNESTYPVIDAECCPHFVLQGSDSKNSKEIIIHKTPYLKWHNFHCENDVIKYNRWICKIVSFYYLTYIDFTYAKIECNNQHTIIYKRSYNSTLYNNDKISYYSVKHLVNSLQNIDSFINKIDFKKVEESYQFVEFLIDKFFQSTYLENATKYLVLYNIIEICFSNDSRQSKKDIRVFHDPKNEIKKAYKESLKTVIKKVESDEKEDFKKTWESLWRLHRLNNVSDKIITYLGSKGLSIENINKHIVHFTKDEKYNITLLRNEVTHEGAGFKNFDFNGINQIASLIVTTLILHILGIDNIDLYHNIDYHDIIIKST